MPKLFYLCTAILLFGAAELAYGMGAAHTATDYAEGSTYASLPAEDAGAVNLLRRTGIKFEKVDLSGS